MVLIDAYSLIHRAYYALPSLTTSRGEPSNAVYGFAMMLLALLEEEQPDYVAAAFDRAGPTFRDELFADYKAHRPSMPEDLRPQIARVEQLLGAFNLAVYGVEGYEADDIIGTLARRARERGVDVLIVTGDRDLLQLVDDRTTVLLTRKGIRDIERLDPKGVEEKLGVPPELVPDLKGLMGDASDNIPGVPKVGQKTAVQLLQQYGSLEGVLAHAAEIKGKLGENLRAYQDQARMSMELSKIRTDAPVDFEEQALRRHPPDGPRLVALFQELEFKALLDRLRRAGLVAVYDPAHGTNAESVRPDGAPGGHTPLAGAGEPMAAGGASGSITVGANDMITAAACQGTLVIARTPDALQSEIDALASAPPGEPLVVGLAVAGPDRMQAAIVGVSLSRAGRTVYVPVSHRGLAVGDQVPWPAVRTASAALLADQSVPKWCHDAKRLRIVLRRHGADLRGVVHDVMVASYLINPEQGDHSMPDVALKFADRYLVSWKQRLSDAATGRRTVEIDDLSPEEVARHLAQEADVIRELGPVLEERLRRDGLWELYRGMELPLVDVLVDVEMNGIRLDTAYLSELSREMDAQVERLTREIYRLAGEEFNINSPKQLSRILFEKLQLPVLKQTKTGPSTDHEVLEALAAEHEVVALLLDYRQVTKLKSTYVDALPSLIHPETGRVHTTFNQAVTATGRLSSTNPNLQNIPVRTEEGRRIRKAFIPEAADWLMLKADYSQIELRVLAHMSGDEVLIDAFRSGQDIHTRTAAEVFGVSPEQVSPEMRSAAKAINFGIVYGISSFGLARGTGLSQQDAQRYINDYFRRYPGVRRYIDTVIETAREQGYVTTLFGRRRYLPDLRSRNWARRSFAERTAMNTPIQGTAADIIKLAMVEVHRRLHAEGLRARLVLQVHDELVLEVPKDELERTATLLRDSMVNVVQLAVPLVVDVEAGPNWLDTEPVSLEGAAHA
ncbi:MAG: DNA polymerase I [Firmicutes bacterium ZCTH02-B6]|nr:MAG: DNA polymerase I [Firmicutes bacterium ZCTH02-B6]